LEQYGVNLSAEAINAELAARGQENLGGAAGEAAKKQAIMDLIMEKSAGSAGNFAKESDTATGAQQRSTAAWEDASAKLGEVLLPIMTTAATKFSELSTWVSQNSGLVTGFAIGIGILAGAILLVNGGLAAYAAVMAAVHGATVLWTGVQWLLNLAIWANPLTWIILGIVALIAAIVLLVMNWDTVVKFITDVWGGFIGWITGVIDGFVGFWNDMWGNVGKFISDVWNNIVNWVTGAVNGLWRTIMSVLNTIKAYWDFAWSWVAAKVNEVWDGITKGVSDGINSVVGFVNGIKDKVLGALGAAGSWLFDLGKNMIQGLIDGAGSLLRNLGSFFLNLVPEFIREPFKQALGIHSPSRVFRGYGVNLGQGLILGIDDMHGNIESAVTGMVSVPSMPSFGANYSSAYTPTAVGGGAGGAVNVYIGNEQLDARMYSVAGTALNSANQDAYRRPSR
ncbi:MAG: hypothetical protein M3536_06540, partial [Actinomycetota bacterium]|nr:hypothetical protein [Actinomycetota bacterium]